MTVDVVRTVGLTQAQADMLADTQGEVRDEGHAKAFHTIVVVGGVGSGKTRGMSLKAIQLAELNAPVPGVYAMPTIPMLEDVAIPEVLATLADLGYVDGVDYIFEKRRKVLRITFDGERVGEIRFRPTLDDRRVVGGNLAFVIVDEAEDNPEETITEYKKRLRHPRAACRQLVLGGTPETLGGHFYREAEEPDHDTHVIRIRTRENHFLPAGYAEGLSKTLDETERELYLEGRFVARRGRVYTQFDRSLHVERIEKPAVGEQVMACDFGRGCMAWGMARVVDDRFVHFHGEQVIEDYDTIRAGKQARKWWQSFFADNGFFLDEAAAARQVTCFVDPAGDMKGSISDVRVLQELGFVVRYHQKHPRIKDRINAVQEKLSLVEVKLDPDGAPYLIRSLEGHCYDKHGLPTKAKPREGAKGLDHGADAIGYLIEYRWPAASSGVTVSNYN